MTAHAARIARYRQRLKEGRRVTDVDYDDDVVDALQVAGCFGLMPVFKPTREEVSAAIRSLLDDLKREQEEKL